MHDGCVRTTVSSRAAVRSSFTAATLGHFRGGMKAQDNLSNSFLGNHRFLCSPLKKDPIRGDRPWFLLSVMAC